MSGIRKRIGMRRWFASFYAHNGNVDSYGQFTYSNPSDWNLVSEKWPCELITTVGGEVIRGRMTNAKSTHVAYGEFFGSDAVTPKMRCKVNGKDYGVTCVIDQDGLQMERRIELRGENDV